MKKFLSILLVLTIAFSLVACNNKLEEVVEDNTEEIINQISTKGTNEITLGSVTYYNTGEVVDDEPDESIIDRLEFASQDGDMICAYAIIESDKILHCLIGQEWYEFSVNPKE